MADAASRRGCDRHPSQIQRCIRRQQHGPAGCPPAAAPQRRRLPDRLPTEPPTATLPPQRHAHAGCACLRSRMAEARRLHQRRLRGCPRAVCRHRPERPNQRRGERSPLAAGPGLSGGWPAHRGLRRPGSGPAATARRRRCRPRSISGSAMRWARSATRPAQSRPIAAIWPATTPWPARSTCASAGCWGQWRRSAGAIDALEPGRSHRHRQLRALRRARGAGRAVRAAGRQRGRAGPVRPDRGRQPVRPLPGRDPAAGRRPAGGGWPERGRAGPLSPGHRRGREAAPARSNAANALAELGQPLDDLAYGRILLGNGYSADGIAAIYRYFEATPDHPAEPHLLVAEAYFSQREYAQALAEWQTLLDTHPEYADRAGVLIRMAAAHSRLGNTGTARDLYREAAAAAPANAPAALLEAARLAERDGDCRTAATEYLDLARLYPAAAEAGEALLPRRRLPVPPGPDRQRGRDLAALDRRLPDQHLRPRGPLLGRQGAAGAGQRRAGGQRMAAVAARGGRQLLHGARRGDGG